jgi:phospholipase C
VEISAAGLVGEGLENGAAVSRKGRSTMSRLALLSILILLLCTAGLLLSLNGCGGGSTTTITVPPPPPPAKIEHVVIIFQENRTPDNLFYGLCLASNGSLNNMCAVNAGPAQYEIQTSNWLNNQVAGGITQPGVIDLGTVGTNPDNYDLSHANSAFVEMCDLNASGVCLMDGADLITPSCTATTPPSPNCPAPPNPGFMYVNPADVQPYLTMAQTYTFADHMFQTNEGPSMPAHQFIISGTSAPSVSSNLFEAENPSGVTNANNNTGCTAPALETVAVIGPAGGETSNPPIYPCFDHPTLTDLLDAANITWRYYGPSAGSIWTAPNAIEHMCVPNAPTGGVCMGTDWTSSVVLASGQNSAPVLTDIINRNLATVSWVIPNGLESDHAVSNDGSGPSYVASIVNAIGNSPYWANTVILLTWDDWGGWYDHVAPQVLAGPNCAQWGCGYVYGFRVPMVVISPYAKAAYISKVNHDFGSILKFVETTFGLSTITTVNGGYADSYADDLSDCFDFTQTPLTFQTVPAALKAEYFLNDKRTPTDPDDD